MKNFFYFFWIVLFGLYACQGNAQKNVDKEKMRKEIYLAGGCFWGTEHFFKLIPRLLAADVEEHQDHRQQQDDHRARGRTREVVFGEGELVGERREHRSRSRR